jgi:Na+/proline symporter
LSGWVIYRYRQTRSLTLAQFFEKRYSRTFRIAAGMLCFISGVLNYAIFPSVGARFVMYVCGIPPCTVYLGTLPLSLSYAVIMALLLGAALWVTLGGGQIGIMLTDAFQSIFVMVSTVILLIYLGRLVSWEQIGEALQKVPNPDTRSMINPFKTGGTRDFNLWFYAIMIFGAAYTRMAWQGNSGYNAAAKSPHEARMAMTLGVLRNNVTMIVFGFFAILSFTVAHHVDFSGLAGLAESRIQAAQIANPAVLKQMTVPMTVAAMLPAGLLGLFVAMIVSLAVTTDDTYLHSWGTIFIQDVVMPFRKKPFAPELHLRLLRWSIFGVALFAFVFSLFFRHTDYILMFFALTGSIFTAGIGSAIIGGLYWKRGTTAGAWAALITGTLLSIGSLVLQQTPFTKVLVAVHAPEAVEVLVNNKPAARTPDGGWGFDFPVFRHEEWQPVQVQTISNDGTAEETVVHIAYGEHAPLSPVPEQPAPDCVEINPAHGSVFPVSGSAVYYKIRQLTGQQRWFFCMLFSIIIYTAVSLAGRKSFNMDKLLHRGKYQTQDVHDKKPVRGWRALFGISTEFTQTDKAIYFGVMIWSYGWVVVNLIVLAINLIRLQSDGFWIGYFKIQVLVFIVVRFIMTIWFGWGAVFNTKELFKQLREAPPDEADDGWVERDQAPASVKALPEVVKKRTEANGE